MTAPDLTDPAVVDQLWADAERVVGDEQITKMDLRKKGRRRLARQVWAPCDCQPESSRV